jgi:hypothetical protein
METMSDTRHRPSVFLSYSSRDHALADTLRRALASSGFDVLRAQETPSGAPIEDAIRDLMRASDVFVVVASPDQVNSSWTAFEVGAAMAWEKPIFVVTSEPRSLPPYLARYRVVDASELPRLIGSVKRETAPLTEEERRILRTVYTGMGVPSDRLAFDPEAVSTLVDSFNRLSRSNSSPDRLVRELLRMRKAGTLPKLRRATTRPARREKRSA